MQIIRYIVKTLFGAGCGALVVFMVVGSFMAAVSQANAPDPELDRATLSIGAAIGGLMGLLSAWLRRR